MMKKTLVGLFVIISASALSWATITEKSNDTMDYTIAAESRSDSTTGNLDGSNTFDRVWDVNLDLTCNASSSDSYNDGVSYQVFEFHTPTEENLDAAIQPGGSLNDSVMFIYCDPFDAANPAANLVFYDDDGGDGLLSAITPADGVTLSADTTYHMVISGYSDSHQGTFTINLGGNAVFGPAQQPPTPTPTPVGAQPIPTSTHGGMALMVALLGVFAIIVIRRKMA